MRRQSSTGRLDRRAKNGRAARRQAPRDYVLLLFMLLTPVVLLLLLAPPDEPVAPASTAAPPPPRRVAIPPKQNEDPRRHRDAALPPAYGATPKIVGLETCAAFRAATDERRRPGVAGLFNTGTNLLHGLLRANCVLPRECARDGDVAKRTLPWEDHRDCKNLNPNIDFCTADVADEMAWQKLGSKHNCTPALFQVPWGKHNPPEWRGQHYGQTSSASMVQEAFGGRREDQILPVVVVKDPLTWLQSMCRVSYAAEFGRYRMAQCCPHPLVNTKTTTGFNNKRSDGVWRSASLAHLWSRWNSAYYTSSLPRLMVRYEDLLFRGEETTAKICDCMGGRMSDVFNPIDVAAKAGAGHGGGGHQGSGRQEQLAKLGNVTRRYGLLDGGDLRVLDRDLDPALIKAFHYGYDHRDASRGQCAPDEGQYLRSLKLKKMGSRTVPLDDENDGIVVAGKFYPNVQNPRARPSMARAILKAEGHEDAARRSRRRDRAPANAFFKGRVASSSTSHHVAGDRDMLVTQPGLYMRERADDATEVARVPYDRRYARRNGGWPGADLKKLHAQTDHLNEYEEDDGDPPPVYNDPSNAPRIVGLDQCAAFRAATTGKRRPAPAGLFNTGTNFLMSLLRMNCILPRECAGRGIPAEKQPDGFPYFTMDNIVNEGWRFAYPRTRNESCAPHLFQVPWGKHNPHGWREPESKGGHLAFTFRHEVRYASAHDPRHKLNDGTVSAIWGSAGRSEILPVVVVKDPLTWMDSMCRVSYTARFPKAKCCPSPVVSTETIVNWVDGKPKSRYASLAKMWSDWNGAYFDSDSPRLMVRYEDLLFRTRETTKQICDCVGGTMTEKFDPIDQGAKYGSEHRMSLADAPGRKNSRRKYANETRRYGHLKGGDLEAIRRDIDPRLLDAFRYAFSDARRREVVGGDAACSAASSSRWRGH